jgi:hypothetical protein
MNQKNDIWYMIYLHLDPLSIYHLFLSCRNITAINELIGIVKESRGQLLNRQLKLKDTARSQLCPYLQTRTYTFCRPWNIREVQKTNANHLIAYGNVFHEWTRVPITTEKLQVASVALPWVYQALHTSLPLKELDLCIHFCDDKLLPWLLDLIPTLRVLSLEVCGSTVPSTDEFGLEEQQVRLHSLSLIEYPFPVEKVFKALGNLKKLNLIRMDITKDKLRHLIPNFKSLEHLCLDVNPIGAQGVRLLTKMVQNWPHLQSLSL